MSKIKLKDVGNDFTKLVIAFSLNQLILHSYFLFAAKDPKLLFPTVIAFFHDIILLILMSGLFQLIVDSIHGNFRNKLIKLFSIFIILVGVFLSSYPRLLREYLIFPVNIFESDLSSAQTLLSDYLGFKALIPSLIALGIGLFANFSKVKIKVYGIFKIIIAVLCLLILVFSINQPSPQPFLYSIQKSTENLLSGKKRVVPSLNHKFKNAVDENRLKNIEFPLNNSLKYSYILLIVLEGQTAGSFEESFFTIKDGFYEQNKAHSVYFSNYYSSNLDSYTSLISMITSIQVPFRAYTDESLYEKVNTAPNIAQDFKNRGFYNVFISCYEYQPFVPTRIYWDKIYDRKGLKNIDNWLSLGSNKMEMATEDKAAISTMVDILKSNEKSLILHEMVYGHSPEWIAKTGKNQNEYHNEYLLDLTNELKKENLWDKTLMIVVSDHGDRAKSSELENYRVPLLFVGQHIDSSTKMSSFLTHTELSQLIYYFLLNDAFPESRESIYFVGSTEKWVYGKALIDKENIFIDDARGVELYNSGKINALDAQTEFQEHINSFNKKYGK